MDTGARELRGPQAALCKADYGSLLLAARVHGKPVSREDECLA
ncbi:hypothetical protein J2Z22_003874 [Paenibacillus forsythiae]|uniref:PIN domain-containing protein n=1 Tax=Paenibacillus forsythiae TaxID=365616 RepID=A0ABU3HE06_9BACL|nr:hypothetical protein [Paenibacillus forsythiae]MDT3428282.1 hypothetical protein [Paenibacillus forsythiae]